jgi:glucosyl-dolichyl phosphate glucuronosyltransferase
MDIIVFVCTHNRSESLAKTLDSLARSTLPDQTAWEILVVDNNSSDRTAETAQDFCRRYPCRCRYVF